MSDSYALDESVSPRAFRHKHLVLSCSVEPQSVQNFEEAADVKSSSGAAPCCAMLWPAMDTIVSVLAGISPCAAEIKKSWHAVAVVSAPYVRAHFTRAKFGESNIRCVVAESRARFADNLRHLKRNSAHSS